MALVVLLFIVVLVLVLLRVSVQIVPAANARVIERLGRYNRTLQPGIHTTVPVIDRVRTTIDLREQTIELVNEPIIDANNRALSVDASAWYSVVDPLRATYQEPDTHAATRRALVDSLRSVVGRASTEDLRPNQPTIEAAVRSEAAAATDLLGVRINRVELSSITSR